MLSSTDYDLEGHYAWLHEGDDELRADIRACVFEFYYTGGPEVSGDVGATVDELIQRGLVTRDGARTDLGTHVAVYAHEQRGERPLWEVHAIDGSL